jgi:hypothetical protein
MSDKNLEQALLLIEKAICLLKKSLKNKEKINLLEENSKKDTNLSPSLNPNLIRNNKKQNTAEPKKLWS